MQHTLSHYFSIIYNFWIFNAILAPDIYTISIYKIDNPLNDLVQSEILNNIYQPSCPKPNIFQ